MGAVLHSLTRMRIFALSRACTLTPYVLLQNVFATERRATMSAERQELTFGDISKVCALLSVLLRLSVLLLMHALHACECMPCAPQALGAEWRELSEEERLPFSTRAAQLTADAPPRQAKAPKVPKVPKAAKPLKAPKKLKRVAAADADEDEDVSLNQAKASISASVDGYGWCGCALLFTTNNFPCDIRARAFTLTPSRVRVQERGLLAAGAVRDVAPQRRPLRQLPRGWCRAGRGSAGRVARRARW
jgi:hypothetical protein